MKRSTIIGVLLVILIAGNGCHYIRHDRKEMRDSEKMTRMGQFFRHNRGMQGMHGRMFQGMGMGMMRGMGRMPMDSVGWMPIGPGRRMMESIPNVTENQKKQIADLMKKHQDDMKKLRDEMTSKMQTLMESHREEMLNILTDEQKKFIETERGESSPNQEKEK